MSQQGDKNPGAKPLKDYLKLTRNQKKSWYDDRSFIGKWLFFPSISMSNLIRKKTLKPKNEKNEKKYIVQESTQKSGEKEQEQE